MNLIGLTEAMVEMIDEIQKVFKAIEEFFDDICEMPILSEKKKLYLKRKITNRYGYIPKLQRNLPYQRRIYFLKD